MNIVQSFMNFQLNDMATFDFTADIEKSVDPKLPETNTNDVEKITDDTSNMAPTPSTSAATEVGLCINYFCTCKVFFSRERVGSDK